MRSSARAFSPGEGEGSAEAKPPISRTSVISHSRPLNGLAAAARKVTARFLLAIPARPKLCPCGFQNRRPVAKTRDFKIETSEFALAAFAFGLVFVADRGPKTENVCAGIARE